MRFVYSLLGIIIGTLILKYTPAIWRFFGRDPDAERVLGSGGTYSFIKIFGVALVILSLLYLFGFFS